MTYIYYLIPPDFIESKGSLRSLPDRQQLGSNLTRPSLVVFYHQANE